MNKTMEIKWEVGTHPALVNKEFRGCANDRLEDCWVVTTSDVVLVALDDEYTPYATATYEKWEHAEAVLKNGSDEHAEIRWYLVDPVQNCSDDTDDECILAWSYIPKFEVQK